MKGTWVSSWLLINTSCQALCGRWGSSPQWRAAPGGARAGGRPAGSARVGALQGPRAPPSPPAPRPQGSVKKEFPQNLGGSDTCYFCQKRVYVMERLSAEGKFFHRSCFQCEHCAATLRLSAYAYDAAAGESAPGPALGPPPPSLTFF